MNFKLWLEDNEQLPDSDGSRQTIIGMLGLTLNNKEGQHVELNMLPRQQMSDKLDGQDYFQKLPQTQQDAVRRMLMMPMHKTLKDLIDLLIQTNPQNSV